MIFSSLNPHHIQTLSFKIFQFYLSLSETLKRSAHFSTPNDTIQNTIQNKLAWNNFVQQRGREGLLF